MHDNALNLFSCLFCAGAGRNRSVYTYMQSYLYMQMPLSLTFNFFKTKTKGKELASVDSWQGAAPVIRRDNLNGREGRGKREENVKTVAGLVSLFVGSLWSM